MSMPSIESPHHDATHVVSHALSHDPAVWPLGRMMLVVFLVCLAVWATVIGYFVG